MPAVQRTAEPRLVISLGDGSAPRAGLRRAMAALDAAVRLPASRVTWWSQLGAALDGVQQAWGRHIAAVESPRGLFDDIRRDAPRLDPALQRLHRAHENLLELIRTVRENIAVAQVESRVEEARRAVATLLGELLLHQEHGGDLLHEAYEVDLGGVD